MNKINYKDVPKLDGLILTRILIPEDWNSPPGGLDSFRQRTVSLTIFEITMSALPIIFYCFISLSEKKLYLCIQ